jgi:protocatechuate 3,4-dioxygenase beta subunit
MALSAFRQESTTGCQKAGTWISHLRISFGNFSSMNFLRIFLGILFLFSVSACSQTPEKRKMIGGTCEDCHLMFEGMPQKLTAQAQVAGPKEPGERLQIRGVIYKPDGKTPAPGVLLYVYQTDNTGKYTPLPAQQTARRHGHLRGWLKTDEHGRYEIRTIRPASYPNSTIPQHIHPIILEPDGSYYWIDDFMFDDDPFLTPAERNHLEGRGGIGVMTLTRDNAAWQGVRNIVLRKNLT